MAGMTRILELDNGKSDEGKLTMAGIWRREFEGVEGAPEKRMFQDWNTTSMKFVQLAGGGTLVCMFPKYILISNFTSRLYLSSGASSSPESPSTSGYCQRTHRTRLQ